jgi:hypothetical protein
LFIFGSYSEHRRLFLNAAKQACLDCAQLSAAIFYQLQSSET